MNTVIITEKLNTHDHGHMYHQKVGKIGMEIGMEYSYTNTIIRKLFDRNFTYSRKILAMEPREVYAFVINNADLLRHTVREAMATELEQLTLDINQVSKVSFHIPQSCLFTYDGTAKNAVGNEEKCISGLSFLCGSSLLLGTQIREILRKVRCCGMGISKMVIKAMSICPSYMQIIRTSRRISILTI